MVGTEETFDKQLEKLEQNPWNGNFERLKLNFAAKGIIFKEGELWRGGLREQWERQQKPVVKKSDEKPYYKITSENKEPVVKTLETGDGQSVSIVLEPKFREQDEDLLMRLVEISLAHKSVTAKEAHAFAKSYRVKFPKLDGGFPWDVKEKIILQQSKRNRNFSFHLAIEDAKRTKKFDDTKVRARRGFTLNNTALEVTPSFGAELMNSSGDLKIPDKPIILSLGKQPAEDLFYRILDIVEKARAQK